MRFCSLFVLLVLETCCYSVKSHYFTLESLLDKSVTREYYLSYLMSEAPKNPLTEEQIHATESAVPMAVTDGFSLAAPVSVDLSKLDAATTSTDEAKNTTQPQLSKETPVQPPYVFDAHALFRLQDDGNFPQRYTQPQEAKPAQK